jgi:outer membrane receptor for ferrienterochelin and colicin
MISSASQQFNVTSRDSGFVAGATSLRQLRQQNFALYFNDNWKASSKLTLTLGTRWEYWSPLDEKNALFLMPVVPSTARHQSM